MDGETFHPFLILNVKVIINFQMANFNGKLTVGDRILIQLCIYPDSLLIGLRQGRILKTHQNL